MADSGAADGRIDVTGVRLVALTAMLLLAFAAAIAMPFNVTGVVVSFDASNQAAGVMATLEMGAVAVGSLLFSQLAPRLRARWVYLTALPTIALVNVATLWAPDIEFLYAARACAGLAAGAMVATVMATAGRSRTPETTFAVINSAVGVMGMILSLWLPRAMELHGQPLVPGGFSPADGLYLTYLVLALVALAFVPAVPVPPRLAGDAQTIPAAAPPRAGWIALFGLGVVFFGHAALVMFIVSVGTEQVSLAPATVGVVFMFGSVFGIVAPLAAGYLAVRYRSLVLTAVLLVVLALLGVALGQARTPIGFFVTAPLFAMMPIALMPILLGALARLDPSGRLTGAHPAFVTLGAALGPMVGGRISASGDYAANGLLVAACVVIGAALLFPAIQRADRTRRPVVAPAAEEVPAATP